MSPAPNLSIIIPVLNERDVTPVWCAMLATLREQGAEIVLVDGGSHDDTVTRLAPLANLCLVAPRGRGSQMNAGAAAASGDIFLFLHADTRLPGDALREVIATITRGSDWGRFDVHIDGQLSGLRVVAWMMNWRSRLTGIATGDQGIFVTRTAFDQVGGFPDIPLMEDLVLSRRLRAIAWPACLRGPAITAGRRWEKHGFWRTVFTMWWLRLRFFLGADPAQLARAYGYTPRAQ